MSFWVRLVFGGLRALYPPRMRGSFSSAYVCNRGAAGEDPATCVHDARVARNGQVCAVLSKTCHFDLFQELLTHLPGLACSTTCHLPNPLPHVVRYDAPPTDQPVLPRKHECQLVQGPEKWHRGEVERRRGDEARWEGSSSGCLRAESD